MKGRGLLWARLEEGAARAGRDHNGGSAGGGRGGGGGGSVAAGSARLLSRFVAPCRALSRQARGSRPAHGGRAAVDA